jgi:hypothetical protein
MLVDESHVAKDSVDKAAELVRARMEMIKKIDKHSLSWPVATEFQKLKRAKPKDDGDDKLFQQVEKKVLNERKKREDEQKAKTRSTSNNWPFRAPQRLSQFNAGYDHEYHRTELQCYGAKLQYQLLLCALFYQDTSAVSSQNSFSYFEEIEKLPFLFKKYGVSRFDKKFTQVVNINNHVS